MPISFSCGKRVIEGNILSTSVLLYRRMPMKTDIFTKKSSLKEKK